MARPRSDIQERILSAAYARFLAEGVEATSLRTIAKDADTSIGMVYYYYTTKNDLFLAIVEDKYQEFLTDLEAILESKHGFSDRISGFYSRIGTMSDSEWEMVRLIFRESLTSNERRDRLKRRFLRGHLPLLLRTILEGIAANEVDRSVHPIILMGCTLAFGGAVGMLGQLQRRMLEWNSAPEGCAESCPDVDGLPEFMRAALREAATCFPSHSELAEQMSRVVARAFSVAPHQPPDK